MAPTTKATAPTIMRITPIVPQFAWSFGAYTANLRMAPAATATSPSPIPAMVLCLPRHLAHHAGSCLSPVTTPPAAFSCRPPLTEASPAPAMALEQEVARSGQARSRRLTAADQGRAGRPARARAAPPGAAPHVRARADASSSSATSSRTVKRSPRSSSHRPGHARRAGSCGGTGGRELRRPPRGPRARRGPSGASRPEHHRAEVGELPFLHPVPLLEEGVHLLPDREHVGVLVRPVEASLDPGEDLHVGGRLVEAPVDGRVLLGDELELGQGVKVPSEKGDERPLPVGPHPVGADHCFISHTAKYLLRAGACQAVSTGVARPGGVRPATSGGARPGGRARPRRRPS